MCGQVGRMGKMDDVFPNWDEERTPLDDVMDEISLYMKATFNLELEFDKSLVPFQKSCMVLGSGTATSHTRLTARDHCTSSTLLGGKGRAGPSSAAHHN